MLKTADADAHGAVLAHIAPFVNDAIRNSVRFRLWVRYAAAQGDAGSLVDCIGSAAVRRSSLLPPRRPATMRSSWTTGRKNRRPVAIPEHAGDKVGRDG